MERLEKETPGWENLEVLKHPSVKYLTDVHKRAEAASHV